MPSGVDFDQPFHCDYKNHTLTVPGEDELDRTINFMIYLTDVTDEHGAIHYVPVPESDPVTGPMRPQFAGEADGYEAQLRAIERSGAAPAGSVFAYGIDVFHRGTNLTLPNAHRFTVTASYKAAGNDQIGWSAWPRFFREPWHLVMDNASVEQRTCLGIPAPGDPFWTEMTLARTKDRWPNSDWSGYDEALINQLDPQPILVPALRERREDIPLLADALVRHFSRRYGRRVLGISDAALEALTRYNWPGNLHELENTLEEATRLADGEKIDLPELPDALQQDPNEGTGKPWALRPARRRAESVAVRRALRSTGGNRTHAARILGISQRALLYKIKDSDIRD